MSNAKRLSLTKNLTSAINLDQLRFQMSDIVDKLEDYLNGRIEIHIVQSKRSQQAKSETRPTFNKGDLIFDFSVSPGVATLQQWDGEKLIYLGFNSLSGNLPQAFNEVPAGVLNGNNLIFTTLFPFKPVTTRLYLNGIRLTINSDYFETDINQITFNEAPLPGDLMIIDYNKK